MTPYKFHILLVLFLLFSAPVKVIFAQESLSGVQTEIVPTDETLTTDKKKDKKKNKETEKDQLEISETFIVSLLINLATVFIIIMFIYYPNYHNQEIIFTYFLFNIAIFLLTFLLNKIKISMGAAFGLFAVFSMLRYRTEGISMKDMTYLFIVIAVGLISAVQLEYYELGIISGILIIATFLLDGNVLIKREYSKQIRYENIELIKPDQKEKLIEDLKNRTGLDIHRVSIVKIDFLRDMANITVYYYLPKHSKDGYSSSQMEYTPNDID